MTPQYCNLCLTGSLIKHDRHDMYRLTDRLARSRMSTGCPRYEPGAYDYP